MATEKKQVKNGCGEMDGNRIAIVFSTVFILIHMNDYQQRRTEFMYISIE